MSHNLSSKWLRIYPERRVRNINEKYFSIEFSIGDYITWSVCRRWDFSDSDKNYHQDLKAAFFFLFHTDSYADSLNLFTLFDGLFFFSFVSAFLCLPIYACNGIRCCIVCFPERAQWFSSPCWTVNALYLSLMKIFLLFPFQIFISTSFLFKNKIASFYFIFPSINACHSFAALFFFLCVLH